MIVTATLAIIIGTFAPIVIAMFDNFLVGSFIAFGLFARL
jgi:hypothetical protein